MYSIIFYKSDNLIKGYYFFDMQKTLLLLLLKLLKLLSGDLNKIFDMSKMIVCNTI